MVQTRRMLATDLRNERYVCEFCLMEARYWSQVELPKGKPGSRAVHHCQRCRSEARTAAEQNKAPVFRLICFDSGEIIEAPLAGIVECLNGPEAFDDEPVFKQPHLLILKSTVYDRRLKDKARETFWEREFHRYVSLQDRGGVF